MTLLERGWRLASPGAAPFDFGGVDYVADRFQRGIGRVTVTDYQVGDTDLTTEDSDRARVDGRRMGQDYRRGLTHTFTLLARGRTRLETEQLIGAAAVAWRGDTVRGTPDAYAELTTLQGGAERTMLGRPRRWAPDYSRLNACEASAVCTFDTRDDVWLGAPQLARIDLRATIAGGFVMPFTFPLVMSPATVRSGILEVGGTLPTPVRVELHGPIANPTVRLTNAWSVRLAAALAADRVVTIDADACSVVDQDGASWAGTLDRGVRLTDLVLQPGLPQAVTLAGSDSTGSAYAVVRWRDRYAGRQ